MKFDKGLYLAYLCFLGLPLFAVGLRGFFGYQVAIVREFSPFVVVPVSLVLGAAILGATIASCGNDMMDFAVSSLIFIIIGLVCAPQRAEVARRRDVRRALRLKHSPAPLSENQKAPQLSSWSAFEFICRPYRRLERETVLDRLGASGLEP